MPCEFKYTKRVEFYETDLAGIMHFSNFFRYMEIAEHAFVRSLGFSIHQEFDGVKTGWPRVHVECDFFKPLQYEDEVEIHLQVAEKKQKALSYKFTFRKLTDGTPRETIAVGRSTAVCVGFNQQGKIAGAIPIPAAFADRIQQAPPE
ncbi:MAG: acyl-CoA thioesterase [Deferribacteres bacterium]|nr:acyl-CoA thioesterase [candidate division KSB1 bacterium]MCB9510487.1 acyl-CoA thioesterase [Deferribacteres bacterium]